MNNTAQCVTFKLFQDFGEIKHGCFPRHGEDNVRPFDSFADCICWAQQCHGTDIIDVTEDSQSGQLGDVLITTQPRVALMVQHADCQPALFYDPVQHVIAAVHSGWRGSVQNIYGKVIERLRHVYHCKPENLLVGIGPSLGPTHAEFIHYRTELPPAFWEYQPTPNHFDFWAISDWQLRNAGILPHHIEIARICTYANPKEWFSYRRDKTKGRHGALIMLDPAGVIA